MDFSAGVSLFSLGLVLGFGHAFDPDHVAAVSTIVAGKRSFRKSSLTGLMWGAGHTATLLLAGAVALPAGLSSLWEALVGLLLVFLGARALINAFRSRAHFHEHSHGSVRHAHFHSHRGLGHAHSHAPFLIGTLHGLAGSAPLLAIVLASVGGAMKGLLFILVFGLGSMLGMVLVTGAISIPMFFFRPGKAVTAIRAGAGSLSILLGMAIMARYAYPLLF